MRLVPVVGMFACVVAASGNVFAQSPAGVQPSPYGSFFGKSAKPPAVSPLHFNAIPRVTLPPTAAKSSVVCGLTLVPADPKVDPQMRRALPETGPSFSIRKVEPGICR